MMQQSVERIVRLPVPPPGRARSSPCPGGRPRWRAWLGARFRDACRRQGRLAAAIRQATAKWILLRRLCHRRPLELAWRFLLRHGPRALLAEAVHKIAPFRHYGRWCRHTEPRPEELDRQRRHEFAFAPLISIVVPTYNTPAAFLTAMLDSVGSQTYGHWELCVADGSDPGAPVRRLLEDRLRREPRLRVRFLPVNLGIVGNSNEALALAAGDYVAFLDHDDVLATVALFEVVQRLQADRDADLLYSDEDKVVEGGEHRCDPFFKPAWSPDYLRCQNYITHLAVYRRELLTELGGFRPGLEGAQDYDLALRATERAGKVIHIPKVLYHWRAHGASVSGNTGAKPYAFEAGRKALTDHLARTGRRGTVEHGPVPGTYHIISAETRRPLVSLLGTGGRADAAAVCRAVAAASSYPEVDVAPAGREVGDQNRAAGRARGELLLFLDPRLSPVTPGWLERLVEHAVRAEVGAVGAKVSYPDGSVAHAGVILGIGGCAGHGHRHFDRRALGLNHRLFATQNFSAVSGGCLLVRKALFEEVGGFDPAFRVTCHDLDLCLRLRQRGSLIVWTPLAELVLPRPAGDGWSRDSLAAHDRRLFVRKWQEQLAAGDPYYNPNLTLDWEDFSPGRPGEVGS